MTFVIRKCAAADAEGRGRVHYQAWMETYRGRMPDEYLDQLRPEKLIAIARAHTDNTFVAVAGDAVVGFISYLPDSRESAGAQPCVEIVALYVLRAYQGLGIGRALIDAVKGEANGALALFVLKGNQPAIAFYAHIGFSFTGKSISQEVPGGTIEELEMVLPR